MSVPDDERSSIAEWRLDMELEMVEKLVNSSHLDTPEHDYACMVYQILNWVKSPESYAGPLGIKEDWVRRLRENRY
jgi:hypothetical protein